MLEVDHSLTEEGLHSPVDLSLKLIGFSPHLLAMDRKLKILNEGLKRKVI